MISKNHDLDHRAEAFVSRHFDDSVEVYCEQIDETKVILGTEYVRHCPMCGAAISLGIR